MATPARRGWVKRLLGRWLPVDDLTRINQAGKPFMRQGMMSGKLEVMGPDGEWHPATFIPNGYQRDGNSDYWKRLD